MDKKVSLGHKSDIAILCSKSDKSQRLKQFSNLNWIMLFIVLNLPNLGNFIKKERENY